MIYVILSIAAISLLAQVLLIILWVRNFKSYIPEKKEPFVSVLLAVRNEEKNLEECVSALVNQKYPSHKYEILIGNDSSEDNTLKLARQLEEDHDNIKVFDIQMQIGLANGKANVLAQLAHQAKGEHYLITDADIVVNKNWIKAMVSYVDPSTSIVNGFTLIKNNLMQHYEWAHALGMIKVLTDLGEPVTAIGNNMLITRKAYTSTGGFEKLKFSLTEDYEIFRAAVKSSTDNKQVVSKDVLAYSKPPSGIKELLHQRKRWMTGAVQLPWYIVMVLFFEGLYYPLIIAGMILSPLNALYIFLTKLLFQSIFIKLVLKKVDLRLKGGLLIYEIYTGFITMLSMLYFILPGKIEWKGRKYKKYGK